MDATDWITAVGTGLAAIGTVGAFIAALVQIKREREARKRLEREAEQRDRRARAERMSAWPYTDRRSTEILLSNPSEQPVYRAVASLVMIQGDGPGSGKELEPHHAGYRATLALIPPGEWRTTVDVGWDGLSGRPDVELAFTDRAGVHWVRCADGSLVEISRPPVEYYDLALPTHWSSPRPG